MLNKLWLRKFIVSKKNTTFVWDASGKVALIGTGTNHSERRLSPTLCAQVLTGRGASGSLVVMKNHWEVMMDLILWQVTFLISNGSSTSLELLLLP